MRCNALKLYRLRPAHESSGHCGGRLSVLKNRLARLDRGQIVAGLLHNAATACRQVGNEMRRMQRQIVIVDQVEVGDEARFDETEIMQAINACGRAGLPLPGSQYP